MFFKKFDLDPRSYGVVLNSYQSGLSPCEMLFNSVPERIQLLQKVLSVARAGAMGRKVIKNYESLIVSNARAVRKHAAISQLLFGYDGFQVQALSNYTIPHVNLAEKECFVKLIETVPESLKSHAKELAAHAQYVTRQI